MQLLRRIVTSAGHRLKWARLGVRKLRSAFHLDAVVINGRRVKIAYPPWDVSRSEAECRHLYWDDPYGLALLPASIHTVVDVGANIGFFSMLALHHFPNALVHAYEPSPALAPILRENTANLGIVAHYEGLGNKDGQAEFLTDGNTLTSTTKESDQGAIPVVSLSTAVQRTGGTVDLLKMDCEGAEWQTLEDVQAWRCVKYLALEYHLDVQAGRTLPAMIDHLQRLRFAIVHFREDSYPNVELIHAKNRSLVTEGATS